MAAVIKATVLTLSFSHLSRSVMSMLNTRFDWPVTAGPVTAGPVTGRCAQLIPLT